MTKEKLKRLIALEKRIIALQECGIEDDEITSEINDLIALVEEIENGSY